MESLRISENNEVGTPDFFTQDFVAWLFAVAQKGLNKSQLHDLALALAVIDENFDFWEYLKIVSTEGVSAN